MHSLLFQTKEDFPPFRRDRKKGGKRENKLTLKRGKKERLGMLLHAPDFNWFGVEEQGKEEPGRKKKRRGGLPFLCLVLDFSVGVGERRRRGGGRDRSCGHSRVRGGGGP